MSESVVIPNFRTFKHSQHDLIEAHLFADIEQHLRQLSADSASMERRGNVELVAARYS